MNCLRVRAHTHARVYNMYRQKIDTIYVRRQDSCTVIRGRWRSSAAPPPAFFCTLKIGEPDEIIDGYTEIFCEGHEIAHGRFTLTVFP